MRNEEMELLRDGLRKGFPLKDTAEKESLDEPSLYQADSATI